MSTAWGQDEVFEPLPGPLNQKQLGQLLPHRICVHIRIVGHGDPDNSYCTGRIHGLDDSDQCAATCRQIELLDPRGQQTVRNDYRPAV